MKRNKNKVWWWLWSYVGRTMLSAICAGALMTCAVVFFLMGESEMASFAVFWGLGFVLLTVLNGMAGYLSGKTLR